MIQSIEDRIRRMLEDKGVERVGFPIKSVSFLMKWNGYEVYEYHLHFEEPFCIGTPWFYLVKGDEITVSNFDQTLCIIEKVYDETHGPDDEDSRRPPSEK